MSKESHVIRVWALRDGKRELEFSRDAPDARRRALGRVAELEKDSQVDAIEMREHLVTVDEFAEPVAARRTLRWVRRDGTWRRLPDSNTGAHGRWSTR